MPDASANFLNVHEWAYGVTEVAHIVSLAMAIGLIAVVDLRLLNQGIVQATPGRLLRATAIGTLTGFVVAITTGFMIFSTDPVRYFAHPTMRMKLILLLVALIVIGGGAVGGYFAMGGFRRHSAETNPDLPQRIRKQASYPFELGYSRSATVTVR